MNCSEFGKSISPLDTVSESSHILIEHLLSARQMLHVATCILSFDSLHNLMREVVLISSFKNRGNQRLREFMWLERAWNSSRIAVWNHKWTLTGPTGKRTLPLPENGIETVLTDGTTAQTCMSRAGPNTEIRQGSASEQAYLYCWSWWTRPPET